MYSRPTIWVNFNPEIMYTDLWLHVSNQKEVDNLFCVLILSHKNHDSLNIINA